MRMEMSDLISIHIAANEALAELARARLESQGIDAVVVGGDAASYLGSSSPFEIHVSAEDVDRAKEVLND